MKVISIYDKSRDQFAVVDEQGEIIVPFGTFAWIDKFNRGYARVKSFNEPFRKISIDGKDFWEGPQWGIIDSKGNIVVPVEYDEIWALKDGYDRMVLYKDPDKPRYSDNILDALTNYSERPKEGSVYFDVTDNQIYPTPFGSRPIGYSLYNNDIYDDDYYEEDHYEEYAGTYAQDVEGYSDEEIGDAFDGFPDAYWNID